MNSYDRAHELAKALNKDNVVIEYREINKKIEADKDLNKKIEEFKEQRLELQISTMQTGDINKEIEEKVKKEYQELLANPLAVEYFEKEVKFNILISDIQKIIYEDITDLLK